MKTNTTKKLTPDCIMNHRITSMYYNPGGIRANLVTLVPFRHIEPTALIPQMTVVFPSFTKADPSAVLIEPEKISI